VNIASQLCDGLGLAHDLDIVHRDITTQNVIVMEDGKIKMMDFGLSNLKPVTPSAEDSSSPGPSRYSSPEQLKNRSLDHRTDIWSLGVILYEMITGQLPFAGENEQALINSILNESPKPIKSLRSGISTKVTRLVDMLLSKSPDQRFANCTDIRRFLDIVFDPEPDTLLMRPLKRVYSNSSLKKWLIIAGLAVIIIFLALTVGKKIFQSSADNGDVQDQSMCFIHLGKQTGKSEGFA
jgi:serine/threonine-protein kinase